MTSPPIIAWLESGNCAVSLIGGKASSLAELQRYGIRIPEAFCITTEAYRIFLRENGQPNEIDWAALATTRAYEAATSSLRHAIATGTMPHVIEQSIEKAWARLASGSSTADFTVAVRSSATVEDGKSSSFAGLFETHLHVRCAQDAIERMRDVWASLWNPAPLAWVLGRPRVHADYAMAVIVQRMVDPTWAGVAYTANPVSGAPWEVVVHGSPGLGESVVSGRDAVDISAVDADSLEINRFDSEPITHGSLRMCDDDVREVARTALRLATILRRPQDVEWAIADGKVFVLQSRAISALPTYFPVDHPLASAVGDWQLEFTEPLSPFGLSLEELKNSVYAAACGRALGRQFENRRVVANGFLYHQEIVGTTRFVPAALSRGLQVLRWLWLSRRADNDFQQAIERLSRRLVELQSRLLGVGSTDDAERCLDDAITAYLDFENDAVLVGVIANASSRLLFLCCKYLDPSASDVKAAALLTGLSSCTVRRDALLRSLANECRRLGVRPENIGPLEVFDSSTRQERADLAKAIHRFSLEFGYIWADTNVKDPAWRENEKLRTAAFTHEVFNDTREGPSELGTRLEHRLMQAACKGWLTRLIPLRAFLFRSVLAIARRYYPYREDYNHHLASAVMSIRDAGRRFAEIAINRNWIREVSDIFLLRIEELRSLSTASESVRENLRQSVKERARDFQRSRRMVPPLYLHASIPTSHTLANSGNELIGSPGSVGVAIGRARIVLNHEAVAHVRPGDILICDMLRPDWSPVLHYVAGVVTDRGYMLSHGANLARELGIPAVMGTGTATRVLQDGDLIAIDGERGLVSILPSDRSDSESVPMAPKHSIV